MTYSKFKSNYDKFPKINLKSDVNIWETKEEVAQVISSFDNLNLVIETYPGVDQNEVIELFCQHYKPENIVRSEDFAVSLEEFEKGIKSDLTDDRIFGRITEQNYSDYFDIESIYEKVEEINNSDDRYLIVGIGAYLFNIDKSKKIYCDLERWEAQLRYRRGKEIFFKNGKAEDKLRAFKRGYFVEWRMADRIKFDNLQSFDYYLDTNYEEWSMITIEDLNKSLLEVSRRPFRMVPYFDLGVWGGDWMKEVCDLDVKDVPMAWCFDGVPEENSLILSKDDKLIHLPALNLVKMQSENLLGERVIKKFGKEFPIRFDFLDTMGGQNLSLQVHPDDEYAKEKFNIDYSQNESYYYLDALDDAIVYLGLNDETNVESFITDLEESRITGNFDDSKHINKYNVKKHDHVIHPSGVIHSSGSGGMVLEISSTPYIFTFKLWDWDRVDLDGKPREINIDHAKNVFLNEKGREYNESKYINQFEVIHDDGNLKIEKTGLHESQFIQTERVTINSEGIIDNNGSVNMLNLVEGRECIIESINNEFEPYTVHYAETFIIPDSIKKYKIKNISNEPIMLMKANVR